MIKKDVFEKSRAHQKNLRYIVFPKFYEFQFNKDFFFSRCSGNKFFCKRTTVVIVPHKHFSYGSLHLYRIWENFFKPKEYFLCFLVWVKFTPVWASYRISKFRFFVVLWSKICLIPFVVFVSNEVLITNSWAKWSLLMNDLKISTTKRFQASLIRKSMRVFLWDVTLVGLSAFLVRS